MHNQREQERQSDREKNHDKMRWAPRVEFRYGIHFLIENVERQLLNCHVERNRDISQYFRNSERLNSLVFLLSRPYLAAQPPMSLVPLTPFLDFARNDKNGSANEPEIARNHIGDPSEMIWQTFGRGFTFVHRHNQ
jgi:hypothetical protein